MHCFYLCLPSFEASVSVPGLLLMTHPFKEGQCPSIVSNENWDKDEGLCSSSDYHVSHATVLLYSYPDISLISIPSICTRAVFSPNHLTTNITRDYSIGTEMMPAVEKVGHTHYTPPVHVACNVFAATYAPFHFHFLRHRTFTMPQCRGGH